MISSPQNFELPTFFTSLRAFTTAAWVVFTPRAHSGRLIERLGRSDRRLHVARAAGKSWRERRRLAKLLRDSPSSLICLRLIGSAVRTALAGGPTAHFSFVAG